MHAPAVQQPKMKGLIIDEPWIGYIISGTKAWEMRSRNTAARGRIGLIRKGVEERRRCRRSGRHTARAVARDLRANVAKHQVSASEIDASSNTIRPGCFSAPNRW
jgi:hypothetical protein